MSVAAPTTGVRSSGSWRSSIGMRLLIRRAFSHSKEKSAGQLVSWVKEPGGLSPLGAGFVSRRSEVRESS